MSQPKLPPPCRVGTRFGYHRRPASSWGHNASYPLAVVNILLKNCWFQQEEKGHRGAVPVVYEACPHPARGWELRLSPVDITNTTPRSERLALFSKSFQARSATHRVPSLSFWKRSFVSSRAFPFLPGWWCQPSPPSLGCAWLTLILIFCLS